MGYLTIPAGAPNCTALTLSMWFRLPAFSVNNDWYSLIEFGAYPPSETIVGYTYAWQEIGTDTYPGYSGPVFIWCDPKYPPGQVPISSPSAIDLNDPAYIGFRATFFKTICMFRSSSGPPKYYIITATGNPGFWSFLKYSYVVVKADGPNLYVEANLQGAPEPYPPDGADALSISSLRLQSAPSRYVVPETWYHLMIAAKLNGAFIKVPNDAPARTHTCVMMLNGSRVAGGDTVEPQVSNYFGTIYGTGTSPGFLMQGIHIPRNPIASSTSLVTDNYDTPTDRGRMFADVQLWAGQFIDPRIAANYAKFVSITDGVGRPVNTSTATAAFGTQTVLLKGASTSFSTNRGNGGAFTKVGTINDFTPTPSY